MTLKLLQNFLFDRKLYQYILAGGTAACIDLSVLYFLHTFFAIHFYIAATVSFILATLVNYILCVTIVFKHQKNTYQALWQVFFVSSVGFCIHHSLLITLVESNIMPRLLCKITAMGTVFLWNFLIRKHWVFVPRGPSRNTASHTL